jgi:chromosome partitioning protein
MPFAFAHPAGRTSVPILLMINLKGGVAKTTNTVAIAECFAAEGLRTLVIDADHQCMSGELLMGEDRLLRADQKKSTLYDLLVAMLDDEFVAKQCEKYAMWPASNISGMNKLSVIPCSIRIEDFSTNMAKARRGYSSNEEFLGVFRRRKESLRRWLQTNYDIVLVDCPPSLALQVKALMPVADGYIVPSVPDRLSVRGSLYLLDRIDKLGYSNLKPIGTLWSLYREQNHVHREVVARTKRKDKPLDRLPRPFETIIPNATAIADSTETDRQHASFRRKYTPQFARLFEELCQEIHRRAEWSQKEGGVQTTASAR